MKIIKDYIRSLEEKDPYQDIWQDLENPIITAVQINPPETDRQIIERLIARIDELEKRIEDLEWYTHED
jgi:hypothetical protein